MKGISKRECFKWSKLFKFLSLLVLLVIIAVFFILLRGTTTKIGTEDSKGVTLVCKHNNPDYALFPNRFSESTSAEVFLTFYVADQLDMASFKHTWTYASSDEVKSSFNAIEYDAKLLLNNYGYAWGALQSLVEEQGNNIIFSVTVPGAEADNQAAELLMIKRPSTDDSEEDTKETTPKTLYDYQSHYQNSGFSCEQINNE